jgi:hypothetical protein
MRRFLFAFLSLTLLIPTSVEAHKTVLYKNQKAGQFCNKAEIKHSVFLPDGTKLTCKKDGTKSRWNVVPVDIVLYTNQKNGQFCKTVDIGKYVILPDETRLICEKDGTKARWRQ